MLRLLGVLTVIVACALAVSGCAVSEADEPAVPATPVAGDEGTPVQEAAPEPPPVPTLVALADIACDPTSPYFYDGKGTDGHCQQAKVGRLVKRLAPDWYVAPGDLQYERATYRAFMKSYDPAFGWARSITQPVPGNHEYYTSGATGYFRYFGRRAGTPEKTWRATRPAPGWLVVTLDSNCEYIGGCDASSPQGRWLSRTLAKATEPCVIAAWHHPYQTSGGYRGNADNLARATPLWEQAAAGGVDIVLSGHDHIYERFAKRDRMQQFVVGSGGKNHYEVTGRADGSRFVDGKHFGVLRLKLRDDGTYRHSFVRLGGTVKDVGVGTCTNPAPNPAAGGGEALTTILR